MKTDTKRRRLLGLGWGIGGILLLSTAAALPTPTPRQENAGPLYPKRLLLVHDSDLTRLGGEYGVARFDLNLVEPANSQWEPAL